MRNKMTRNQAIKFSKAWEKKGWDKFDKKTLARFQLNERYLAVPWSLFHESVELLLGRPVWTHEFANCQSLINELQPGKKISLCDVFDKLPKDKPKIIIGIDGGKK